MSEGDESCTMDLNQEEFKQRIPDILQHFAADASNRREETHIEVLQRLRTAGRIPIIGSGCQSREGTVVSASRGLSGLVAMNQDRE